MDQPKEMDTRQRHAVLETVKVRNPDNPDEFMIVNERDYRASKGKYELWKESPKIETDIEEEDDDDTVTIPEDYAKLNVPELKELAASLEIEDASSMKKDELISAIGEYVDDGDDDEEDDDE